MYAIVILNINKRLKIYTVGIHSMYVYNIFHIRNS